MNKRNFNTAMEIKVQAHVTVEVFSPITHLFSSGSPLYFIAPGRQWVNWEIILHWENKLHLIYTCTWGRKAQLPSWKKMKSLGNNVVKYT